jgi:hypothetical protein
MSRPRSPDGGCVGNQTGPVGMAGQTSEARGPAGSQRDLAELRTEVERAAQALAKTRSDIERLCRALLLFQQREQAKDKDGTIDDAREILASLEGYEISESEESEMLSLLASPSDWVPGWILLEHERNFRRFLETGASYMRFVKEHGAPPDLEFLSDTFGLANRVVREYGRLSATDQEHTAVLDEMTDIAAGWLEPGAKAAFRRAREAFEAWEASPTEENEKALLDEIALAGAMFQEMQLLDPSGERGIELVAEMGEWTERLRQSWRDKALRG